MTELCKIMRKKSPNIENEALKYLRNNISIYSNGNLDHIINEAVKMIILKKRNPDRIFSFNSKKIWKLLESHIESLILEYFDMHQNTNLHIFMQTGLSSFKTLYFF